MKYVVTRTSTLFVDEDPKIKGIQKEMLPFLHTHGDQAGNEELIVVYTVDIGSIEELHQFIKDCGHHIIVSNPLSDGSGFRLPQIEVYDDYRE